MVYSTAFVLEHPQSVIDELLKEQLSGSKAPTAGAVIDFFRQHFGNEHILDSIPTAHGSGLVRVTAMLQQNGMEPEYFYAATKNGCNPGYFKLAADGAADDDCGGSGMAARKSARFIFMGEGDSAVRTCHYYDDSLDDAALNSVHNLVGFFEDGGTEGEGEQIFHIIFTVPLPKQGCTGDLEWPPGCSQLLRLWSISRPAIRTADGLAIGAMSLNLHNVKEECDFDAIVGFARSCFRRVAVVKVDGQSLSAKNIVPEFDIESGSLRHTELQLPNPCCLILDERQMECGQLDECATKNIRALISIATQQRISYSFPFQSCIDLDVDYPCLIVSRDKSLLPANWRLDYLKSGLREANGKDRRAAIEGKRMGNADIEQAVADLIEHDYVAINKQGQRRIDEQQLHGLLTLSRLLAIDAGRNQVGFEDWQAAVRLTA